MCVCCERCVCFQAEVSAPGSSLIHEESYRLWCVVVCDLGTSWMRRPWPTVGYCAKTEEYNIHLLHFSILSTVLTFIYFRLLNLQCLQSWYPSCLKWYHSNWVYLITILYVFLIAWWWHFTKAEICSGSYFILPFYSSSFTSLYHWQRYLLCYVSSAIMRPSTLRNIRRGTVL